jgi:UDP:flavonoid glycosyltransferase YjiC (YdhE family)
VNLRSTAPTRTRILWAPYSQRGSIYPIVPVISALRMAGAEILLLGLEELRRFAELLDIGFRPYHTSIRYDWSRPNGLDRHGLGPSVDPAWFNTRVSAEIADILSATENFAPDVLLADSFVTGAGLAAELVDLPWASYVHYLFDESATVDAMHRVWWQSNAHSEADAYCLWWNSVRRVAGLPDETRARSEAPWYRMSSHRTFLLGHPHLRRGTLPLPAYVSRTSIPPWDEPQPEPWVPIDPVARRTAVLVSNSATWQNDVGLITATLDGLAESEVDVYATIAADHPLPSSIPANARVHRYMQHSSILPNVDAVICASGYGLVSRALWNGLPVILSPGRADQPYVAEAVVQAGCGTRISSPPTATEVAAAVTRVLTNPSIRSRALELAGPQSDFAGADECAQMVTDLKRDASSPLQTTSNGRRQHT